MTKKKTEKIKSTKSKAAAGGKSKAAKDAPKASDRKPSAAQGALKGTRGKAEAGQDKSAAAPKAAGGKPKGAGDTPEDGQDAAKLKDNATPISQAAYATRIGVKRQYINKLVKAGTITLHDGLVIPHLADKERAAWADPAREHRRKENTPDNGKSGSVTEGDPDEYSDAKALESLKDELSADDIRLLEIVLKKLPSWTGARRIGETVKARNELLDFQKARHLLVEADGVENFWAEKLSMVKTKLLTLPRSMAQKMASLALKYAAELGRDLVKAIVAIKKKKAGKWSYNKRTGAVELFAGQGKKPFVIMPLNPEAPEFAESMITNETETALSTEVHAALNELAGEKESEG